MQHPFDTAIALEPAGQDRFFGRTSPAYANMVGPFGGTTTAVLLNAALRHPQRQGDPIALTVNFASPVADGDFEIEAVPVRTNRSTQHWSLQLRQGAAVAASATAVFALRRETWSAREAVMPPDMPAAAALARAPFQALPTWAQRYDMRFTEEDALLQFDGQEHAHSYSRMWVRDEPPRPLDFAALAALCDCFLPRIFYRRHRPAPVGTVSLTSYFHADASLLAAQGEHHLLGVARAQTFRNGYFDQSAEVWGQDGQLLATTHQMVYFRE